MPLIPFGLPGGEFLILSGTPPLIGPQPVDAAAPARALCVEIADAVVALIRGTTFDQPITVGRLWVETQRRETMLETDPATIFVYPRTFGVSAFDLRPRNAFVWDIGVWISKAVKTTNEAIDPIAELMEQVVSLLVENRMFIINSKHVQFIGVSPDPAYDSIQLLDLRVFRCVFVATYRTIK